jgi:hypothetical protein
MSAQAVQDSSKQQVSALGDLSLGFSYWQRPRALRLLQHHTLPHLLLLSQQAMQKPGQQANQQTHLM